MKHLLTTVLIVITSSLLIGCIGDGGDNSNNQSQSMDMSSRDMDVNSNQTSDFGTVSDVPDLESGNSSTGSCLVDEDCTETDGNSLANPNKRYCVSVEQRGNSEVRFCSECRTADDCTEEGAICSLNSGRCLKE